MSRLGHTTSATGTLTENFAEMTTTTRIHALLEKHRTLLFPGVYDALSAKLVERAGFPLTFISGYSVAASHLGLPDFGYLTQTEIVAATRRVCASVSIPIIIDADTGYGNPST